MVMFTYFVDSVTMRKLAHIMAGQKIHCRPENITQVSDTTFPYKPPQITQWFHHFPASATRYSPSIETYNNNTLHLNINRTYSHTSCMTTALHILKIPNNQ